MSCYLWVKQEKAELKEQGKGMLRKKLCKIKGSKPGTA
jgi:hypothetical protein